MHFGIFVEQMRRVAEPFMPLEQFFEGVEGEPIKGVFVVDLQHGAGNHARRARSRVSHAKSSGARSGGAGSSGINGGGDGGGGGSTGDDGGGGDDDGDGVYLYYIPIVLLPAVPAAEGQPAKAQHPGRLERAFTRILDSAEESIDSLERVCALIEHRLKPLALRLFGVLVRLGLQASSLIALASMLAVSAWVLIRKCL